MDFMGNKRALLSLRDVADVEAYVIATIDETGLPLSEQLVSIGIDSVCRLECALPPQRPMLPLLDKMLSPRLNELWRSGELDRAAEPDRAAAIAA
jgi:hypothetical protein